MIYNDIEYKILFYKNSQTGEKLIDKYMNRITKQKKSNRLSELL